MKPLPIFPHLGMGEEEFDNICRELFEHDPVLAGHLSRIEEYERKLKDYEERIHKFQDDIRKFEAREENLNAELKTLTREKREIKGSIAGLKYHEGLSETRLRQARTSIEKRKKQLYLAEARRRLGQLGKELKLGGKGYRKGPTIIIDKSNDTETTLERKLVRTRLDGNGTDGNQPQDQVEVGSPAAGEGRQDG